MDDIDVIIRDINGLENIFLHCKSFFPALGNSLIGQQSFDTAPYYQARGYKVSIHTDRRITQDFLDTYSRIGRWLNENAIIRLYGIMDYYRFLNNIDQSVDGWKEVDLMRRMRNVFTKTNLNYQPSDQDNMRLRQEIIARYSLIEDQQPKGEIPTPIDKVLQPIFEGCRNYIKEKGLHNNANSADAKDRAAD